MIRALLIGTVALGVGLLLAVYTHYQLTGLTPHRYTTLLIERVNSPSSTLRQQTAALIRATTLESGLIADPLSAYPPDLQMPLPTWRGNGASPLRSSVAPRYRPDGQPIALADSNLWALHTPQTPLRDVRVASSEALTQAVQRAKPGMRIVLEPGHYIINQPLALAAEGNRESPLQISADRLGDAVLTFRDGGALNVTGAFWTVSDLVLRGECADPCRGLLMLDADAAFFTARNLFVSGADQLLAPATGQEPGNDMPPALAEGITLLGGDLAAPGFAKRATSVRRLLPPTGPGAFLVVCPSMVTARNCDTTSLEAAARQVAAGGMIFLRRGDYRQAAHFRTPGVHLLAEPGARLLDTATGGKGAIVVSADITVEGLECSGVTVSSGNGACLRQNRGDVTLLGVHFHHSQMGVLTGHEGGNITIYDSYLHDSGSGGRGNLGHNVYVNSGRLAFIRSWSLMARNAGHEIKSRAERTLLQDCLVASVNARDSRLVDVPEGGVLEISGCVLGEGPRSENWDMIGYGLEIGDKAPPHAENVVRLVGNTFYSDRPQGTMLLNAAELGETFFERNITIGVRGADDIASAYPDRESAGVPAFPVLKALAF
jgi:hypothetical protein